MAGDDQRIPCQEYRINDTNCIKVFELNGFVYSVMQTSYICASGVSVSTLLLDKSAK